MWAASTADSTPQEKANRARTDSSCANANSGNGERWRATSAQTLVPEQEVRVISRRDLTLEVVPIAASGLNTGGST